MTNFNCMFCGEKMLIPKDIKKKISPVTHLVWHEDCISNPEYELSYEQKVFYMQTGTRFY